MILIVSFRDNPHVQAVLHHVSRPAIVFDVADFPSRASLEVHVGNEVERFRLAAKGQHEIRVEDVGAVWYRRERPMELDPALMDSTSRQFAWSESTEALTGLWRSLDCFWMNPPAADEVGQRKVHQLQTARRVGLSIPDTLITNDPASARAFVLNHREQGVIRKALRNIAAAPRPTAIVTTDDLDRIDAVRYAPVTFQQFVPAELDLRVIVVEDEVFATAIRSEPQYQTDYRTGIGSAEFFPYTVPDGVASALLELHRQLGLVYGASDFRVTPSGEHLFLEVNPAGEYLFASERTGQPVPQAIAACLERHDRDQSS